ncbi:MAG: TrmH family RNA methyltransferase [Candidatus Shikimatogenerans sp. Tduv]|uniref:TrmH family RNA methyltransferase n=1 Tax=Candidatus Shikimatogenerans sp. Tduv TaxID=3158567 RepID=A0AAU7QTE3_9FLAO
MYIKKNIIYGYNNIQELILIYKYKKYIYKLFFIKKYINNNIFKIINKYNIPFKIKNKKFINKICKYKNQGIIAYITDIKFYKIKNIINNINNYYKNPTILIINKLYNYKNFGNIIRNSVLFNVQTIIINNNFFFINKEIINNSSGLFFKIPICKEKNILKTIIFLKKKKYKIFSLSNIKFTNYINKCNLNIPLVVILGNEDKGINNKFLNISDKIIKIPMIYKYTSLNVSHANSIILYEIFKQKLKNIKFF